MTAPKRRPARIQDHLDAVTSPIKRKKFWVYDIESKSHDSQQAGFDRPFLVGVYDPDNGAYAEFNDLPHLRGRPWQTRHIQPGGCIDRFLNKVLVPELAGYAFYAHNGGSFDHLFLPAWLQAHRDEFGFEIIPVQSSIQVLRVWRKPESPDDPIAEQWEFLDSMKLLPMGLAKACETFGVDTKIDHDLHRHEDDPSWKEYLFQDCKSLGLVLNAFYEMVARLEGEVGITTPSTSMKLFRRKYLGKHGTPSRIPRHQHWDSCVLKGTPTKPGVCGGCAHAWIRRGYYGGRTEIFRMFGENLNYYDINSSYVAAMKQDMPIGERAVEWGATTWKKHRSEDNPYALYAGFAEVTVYVPPECPLPPLPHKSEGGGKLKFPTGTFHGVWSLDELKLLEDPMVNGRILHTVCTVWFRLRPCFRQMVTDLWDLRNPKLPGYDAGLSAVAKLLGNGIYGKFAMRPERTSVVFEQEGTTAEQCFLCREPVPPLPPELRGEAKPLCTGCEGSKAAMDGDDADVWYQAKTTDAPYIIPHISSYITALARICLWTFMRMALRTRAAGRDPVRDLVPGEVVFPGEAPEMVLRSVVYPDGVELWLRDLDTGDERAVLCPSGATLPAGGKVFYVDTDSVVTDVELPWDAGVLGELKNEYPGEKLRYLAVQPKVYVIEKMHHNARVAEARDLWARLERGELEATAAAALRARKALADERAALQAQQATYRSPAWWDVRNKVVSKIDDASLDPIALKPYEKVTMKGFPKAMRTRANLELLRGGPIDWGVLAKGKMLPLGPGKALAWPQLERVRSIARVGFRRPPCMKEGDLEAVEAALAAATEPAAAASLAAEAEALRTTPKRYRAVSKSFQLIYDKRAILDDATGRTRAVVLDEPVGGARAWDAAAE